MSALLRAVLVASAAAALVVPAASGKVYLSGIPANVAPGSRVEAHVAGCETAPSCARTVRGTWVYLARATPGPIDFTALPRPRWFVGQINADGRLRFKVPKVTKGSYRLIARMSLRTMPHYLPVSNVFTIRTPAP